jgi:hypothetical protein
MLIIALVLALIGLVALVFAVVTSNELVAWVCIGASVLGVVLLIIDALRERQRRDVGGEVHNEAGGDDALVDYPDEVPETPKDTGDSPVDGSSEETAADASEESAVPAEGGDERAK